MEDYYRLISSRILDGYDEMLDRVPQPQMLGGKRMRKFVLPGNSESDYPGTLSVGRMDGEHPATLGGEFWKDFGNGFPKGGAVLRDGECIVYTGGQVPVENEMEGGMDFFKKVGKVGKKVGKKAVPVLKEVGKEVLPVLKEIGTEAAKEVVKQGVKSALSSSKSAPEGAGRKRGRPKKMVGGDILKDVGKIAKDVGKNLAKEGVKYAVKSATKGGVRRKKKPLGEDPITYTPSHLLDGGALLKNVPSQYHSSVYPPALASYIASLPKGHDAYGKGRMEGGDFFKDAKKIAKDVGKDIAKEGVKFAVKSATKSATKKGGACGGARAARGAIVKEVMKKHGLSLPEASKFVKEKGLY